MTHSLFSRAALIAALVTVPLAPVWAGFEFIPPPAGVAPSPAFSAPPPAPRMNMMTPSPAGAVVSEALDQAALQRAPQSITPPAASPAPVMQQPVAPRRQDSPAPSGLINLNPLARGSHDPAGAAMSDALAQAMVNEGGMVSGGGRLGLPRVPASPPAYQRASLPIPAMEEPAAGYDEAIGFGRDLPVPLAVSQIVPPGYAVSYEEGVAAGREISWEGGRPWNEVLKTALRDAGLQADIQDGSKTVMIRAGRGQAPAPARYIPVAEGAVMPDSYLSAAPPAADPGPLTSAPLPAREISPVPALPPGPSGEARYSAATGYQAPYQSPGGSGLKTTRSWEAARGSSLRTILSDWSNEAGVELFWSSEYDFPVESSIRLSGTFEEAVKTLLNGLRDAQPRPIGRLHPNLPAGPSVLVIETKHILE